MLVTHVTSGCVTADASRNAAGTCLATISLLLLLLGVSLADPKPGVCGDDAVSGTGYPNFR